MSDRQALVNYLAEHDARCPSCRYQLRGLTHDRCPECGDVLRLGVDGDDPAGLGPLLAIALPATAAATSGIYWLLFIVQDIAIDPLNSSYGPVDFLLTFALLLAAIPLILVLAMRRAFVRLPPKRRWMLARLSAGITLALIAIDLAYNLLLFY